MEKEPMNSPVKLTIGILVSNRIQFIRKVMEGMKPLLEGIPSELIAIDTKGAEGDGSIEIVKEYTDNIYPFTWCNDFSKARNVVLERAKGEWLLSLDDDEVFEGAQELIEFLQNEAGNPYRTGSLVIRNYDGEGGFTAGTAVRLFRRSQGTRWVGAVHEYINDANPPTKQLSCVIHHYGYAFQSLEEAQKHQERNVSILRHELEKSGYTPHLCAQMTQELIYLETSTDEGFRFAQDALLKLREENQLLNPASQYIMYATVLYYIRKQDIPGAMAQTELLQKEYPLLKITRLTLHGICANLALEQKDLHGMLKHALAYTELWDWKQTHPVEAASQIVLGLGQYCEERYYFRVLHIGAAAANELENFTTAKLFWNRFPWKAEGFDASLYQQDLSNTLQGYKRVLLLQKQQSELLGQFMVLEQAALEAALLEKSGQLAVAEEYRTAMRQLLSVLQNTLQPLLCESSPTTEAMKTIGTKPSENDLRHIKELFQKECENLLNKNKTGE